MQPAITRQIVPVSTLTSAVRRLRHRPATDPDVLHIVQCMRGRGLYAYLTIFLQKNTTRLHRIVAGTSAVPLHTQRLRESPDFFPRIAIVLGFERDDAVLWEICNVIGSTCEQERQESREVQEVTGEQDLTSFAT